jgi:hypothetical protein
MQTATQILQAIRKLGEKRIPLTRVYRCLFSEDLFLAAYAKIYKNQGILTPGTENDTADDMNIDRIHAIVEALRDERFKFRDGSQYAQSQFDTLGFFPQAQEREWVVNPGTTGQFQGTGTGTFATLELMRVVIEPEQFKKALRHLLASVEKGAEQAVQAFDGAAGAWPLSQDR